MVAGCTGDFEKQWSAAMKTEPAEPLLGCWAGTWSSQSTGHTGRLRMVVTKHEESYRAQFLAVYGGIFTFGMAIPLEPDDAGEKTTFKSEHDLGWPWGKFTWAGQLVEGGFEATYESAADKGIFKLKRPTRKKKSETNPAPEK